jgi:photosystem II protein
MRGTSLTAGRVAAKAPRGLCLKTTDIFKKSSAPAKTAKGSKVLTSGKDIKAQQFDSGLTETDGVKVALGFTKSNELFVGSIAMLGIAASIIGELLTGKGAIAQLGLETGLPLFEVDDAILALIGFNIIAALLPTKGKFVADEDELEERPDGVLQDPSISVLDYKRFFGVSGFGFTKANELFVGRMAQLGFAISLIGETLTGKGILAQFDIETGLPLNETEPLLVFFIIFTLFAAINEGSGKFVDED